ncbi:MAG: hypothetical protein ACOYZ7_20540 [Chloroflexota bacterium]
MQSPALDHTLAQLCAALEHDPAHLADILERMDDQEAAKRVAGLEDPKEVRPLLLHPDDSAGGLVTSEFLALRRRATAGARPSSTARIVLHL